VNESHPESYPLAGFSMGMLKYGVNVIVVFLVLPFVYDSPVLIL